MPEKLPASVSFAAAQKLMKSVWLPLFMLDAMAVATTKLANMPHKRAALCRMVGVGNGIMAGIPQGWLKAPDHCGIACLHLGHPHSDLEKGVLK